jgi:predicted RNA-binding protein YlxR (DUF448 family)
MSERRCSACRESCPATQMIRLVASPAGELRADLRAALGGRGAYACAQKQCLARASQGAVSRSLRRGIRKADKAVLLAEVQVGLERLLAERLGRLQKQRSLHIGAMQTESADRAGTLQGVVAAFDISERSSKKVDALRAPVYRVAHQAELGGWLGRGATGVVGVPNGPAGVKALVEADRFSRLANSVAG